MTYNSSNWHTSYDERDWIITDGWTVILDGITAEFIQDVSITIEAGGTLIVKNSMLKVDSDCDYWTGIIVEGDPDESQFNNDGSIDYSSHGYVKITNSTISDAVIGVHSLDGGIIETSYQRNDPVGASRNQFLNNLIGIKMEYSPCSSDVWVPRNDNAIMKCASLIQDCDFNWTSSHPSSQYSAYSSHVHIKLENIMGLEITGCQFFNNDITAFEHSIPIPPGGDGQFKRGTGIHALNATIWVRNTGDGTDTDNDGCPNFNGVACYFEGLSRGVYWDGSHREMCDLSCETFESNGVILSEYESLNVTGAWFVNCYIGLEAFADYHGGGQEMLIAQNHFEWNLNVAGSGGQWWKNMVYSSNIWDQTFIHLNDVFDFTIYNNEFTTNKPYCSMIQLSNHLCGGTSYIQKNIFTGGVTSGSAPKPGTKAIRLFDNSDPLSSGTSTSLSDMLILCNEFNNFDEAIVIEDADVSLKDQQMRPNESAGNDFVNCNTHIVNNGNAFTYYQIHGTPLKKTGLVTEEIVWQNPEGCDFTCENWPSVGMESINAEIEYSIYPNPSTGLFTLETKNREIEQIMVYNLSGALVYQNKSRAVSSIDLSELPNGMYLLQIHLDKQVLNQTIIISK